MKLSQVPSASGRCMERKARQKTKWSCIWPFYLALCISPLKRKRCSSDSVIWDPSIKAEKVTLSITGSTNSRRESFQRSY